jgi:SET domain-containing protein
LFNHSYTPNAKYVKNYEKNTLEYCAIKDIKPGEEITTNYNGNPDNQKKVWFDKE